VVVPLPREEPHRPGTDITGSYQSVSTRRNVDHKDNHGEGRTGSPDGLRLTETHGVDLIGHRTARPSPVWRGRPTGAAWGPTVMFFDLRAGADHQRRPPSYVIAVTSTSAAAAASRGVVVVVVVAVHPRPDPSA